MIWLYGNPWEWLNIRRYTSVYRPRLWYKRRPSFTGAVHLGGCGMGEPVRRPDVLMSGEREGSAQDSKAVEPTNESHKEDFDALLKRAVQVK